MNTEKTFQLVAVVLFLLSFGVSAYVRSRANRAGAKAGDRISWRGEGATIMVGLRVAGLAMWLGLLAYLINPAWMAWSQAPLPVWLRWVGVLLAAVAVPLLYWMFYSLGLNVTDTVAIRTEHRLVTHGPYRWIRHPLYSFGALLFLGFILLSANWFIAAAALCGGALLARRTPIEEARLTEQFGEEYRGYMRRTGRFLPRLTRPETGAP